MCNKSLNLSYCTFLHFSGVVVCGLVFSESGGWDFKIRKFEVYDHILIIELKLEFYDHISIIELEFEFYDHISTIELKFWMHHVDFN